MIDIHGRKAKILRPKEIIVEGESVQGSFEYSTYNIECLHELFSKELLITTLHEAGHGLLHRLNIILPPEIEEVTVDAFANHVTDNFAQYSRLYKTRRSTKK